MKKKPVRILHLEDDLMDAEMIHARLESENIRCEIIHVNDRPNFEQQIADSSFDLILSDYSLPDFNGNAALKLARKKQPDVPFILISGTLGEEQAVESLKNGATDYIIKQRLERLGPAVSRALQEARERKERERVECDLRMELKASEKRFRTLVEQSLVGIYVIQDDKLVYVNPSMEKILGYSAAEIAARPLKEFIYPEDFPTVQENIDKRNRGMVQEVHYMFRILRSDKSVAFVEARGGCVDNYNLRPAIIGTLLDITERKLAEDRLRQQATLLDKAQDAICVQDLSQRILYWNKGAERLYEWSADEAVGENAARLLFKSDLTTPIEMMQLLTFKGEWSGELNQVTKSGKSIIVQSRRTLVRDEFGKPHSIFLINTDITEKKFAETKLLRTQRMESIGALAGGIAHDLNNCLAPILMAADLIRDNLRNDESKSILDTMHTSAQRGADLVRQILSFSRGVTGEHSVLQIKHLISDMETFAKSTFPRTIQFRTQVKGKLHPIKGDATQIHQILMNLCINARDAMPEGGQITIEAFNLPSVESYKKKQVDGPHVVLKVRDTGHGIPPEVIDRIFEPFFTTKEIGKGTGLGLSTVMEIIKTHTGFLEVASELNNGTTFEVFLPATDSEQALSPSERSEIPNGSGETVLLVDDEIAILEMIKLMLEAHNYHVLTAKNGFEAISVFTENSQKIKAVITDVLMPNMSGPELVKQLQQINPSVKIICMSGLSGDASSSEVEFPTVETFLKKPFNTESLLLKLHELANAGSALPMCHGR